MDELTCDICDKNQIHPSSHNILTFHHKVRDNYRTNQKVMKFQGIITWLLVSLSTLSSTKAVDLSYADFSPIGCNQDTSSCVPWSSLFSTANADLVTIPCGKCVTMAEYNSNESITLDKGLDIQGTLHFPQVLKYQ